jgi:ABC-type dipeptide/oligopeptide/nickel transport system permease component
MTRFLALRSLQSVALLIGAMCIVFFMVRLTGDPVALMLPKDATNETRNEFRTTMGLDRPLPVQFLEYITQAARGDLGQSLSQRIPNLELIAQRLPATLELAFASLALALGLAVPLGLMAGLKPGGAVDALAQTVAFTGQIVPGFWLAMILILTFAVQLRWLPSFGRDSLASLVLPSIALGFSSFGQLLRLTRASVLEVRGADFVRTAKAKGLVPWLIAARHVLPNVLIPLISVAGIQFTYLLGGSVYIETIFAWPGLGSLLSSAIQDSDFPLVQAITILISLFAIGVQLLTDIAYALVDPRVQHG